MTKDKVLIIDDEEHIVELIRYNLENAGYDAVEAYNGVDGIKAAKNEKPTLILLDVMLPMMDGLEVCRKLRKDDTTKHIPIIMLTAKSEEIDKILGLELGADDYITKPFSVRELLARIKAVLRRTGSELEETSVFSFSDVTIDYDKHLVTKNNVKVDLTLKEYELLDILIKNRGKVLKRDLLLDKIWGYEYVGETRTVDVHIRHLRQKLEDDDKNPVYIETVRGIGYRFNDLEL
ncbi:response regulator transcription factor [Proteiniclasticum sp. SCR006]|uniref:Stage 0 sporulation protein A homolog n=1 Tax=Proteiniclasticum aestuarii TaxID=2817862 RepID=A0A939H3S4_9CLOT|nr:response regulator transcription factor [Proteiniclasticum aestuarii]MBO1263604.1 response regulator transcription factor [Proteiniclasticum aestuarii]